MNLATVVKLVYLACVLYIGVFTLGQNYLFMRYLMLLVRGKHRSPSVVAPQEWPHVAVQLPIYNEKTVIERLLDAVTAFDYPRERLTIQVLDDSTDDTPELVARLVAKHQANGINIQHIHRSNRAGYKAGAMQQGLELIPHVEYTAIFDSDFVPPVDFLRQTIPPMVADPTCAFIQTRWGHLNADENWLTNAQALSFDSYFMIDQTARARIGLLLTFNGSGGVWRTKAIHDSGGWASDTLTEDLDLSYRAQLNGWHGEYMPEVVVLCEIPMTAASFKTQQMRWAIGSDQTFFKLVRPLWRSQLSLHKKLMGSIHLMQYTPAVFMLMLMALAPLMLITKSYSAFPSNQLALLFVLAPIITLVAQIMLGGDWPRRILYYPFVVVIGIGMMWNNTRAAWRAVKSWLGKRELEFVRTPKFAHVSGRAKSRIAVYASSVSLHVYIELGLAVYALGTALVALRSAPSIAPLFGTYAIALALIGGRALFDN